MKAIWIIARRELGSFFDSLLAYIMIVAFLGFSGFFTWIKGSDIFYVNQASLQSFFGIAYWTLFFFIPALTMRVIAEERKTGTIEKLIYPAGFYKTKAKSLKKTAQIIVENFNSQVPSTIEDLLRLPGVGRKTANLVLNLGFNIPAICVDTHVHRISNRLGWVNTKTADETEAALMKILPRKYWIEINELLVKYGQAICKPTSPWCSRCPISNKCPRIGVKTQR